MSIQRYLLIVIISVVTLASFGAALQGYKASKAKLNHVFDEEMRSFALALFHSPIKPSLNEQATSKQASTDMVLHSVFAYQIWFNDVLQLKSDNAPKKLISKQLHGFSDGSFLGKRWRVFVLAQNDNKVIVAQPIEQRFESVEQVLLEAILPIVYAIPIIGLLVFLAINSSLKPLKMLSKQLQQKNANDLSPIQVKDNSAELKPIEQTLNSLLNRLESAFDREQRLSSDAAHELRTPISVLKLTAHNLKIAFESNNIQRHHIDELNNNTVRMAHVIEQIITLNRTTPENFEKSKSNINIRELLQNVISENYHAIELAKQSISLTSESINIDADQFSLTILFDNLIKNANKYSGEHSQIKITVVDSADFLHIFVEDSGVGIDQEYLDKVFQRFYRIKQHVETGSGLGLSIVKHIIDLHDGDIQLMSSDTGGLKVDISLPKTKVNPKAKCQTKTSSSADE
jgi:two-component system sensor histidine kinase QseC